jgi:protein required for attachment to host cells
MKPKTTWILIANGTQAKVFEYLGRDKGLAVVDRLLFEQEALQNREIMSDKPGRSFGAAGGGRRSAVAYSTDPVAVRERRFVENVADVLDKELQAGAFERLVIAAAPTALGDIRPALSKGLRDVVLAELPKDLTNAPTSKLEAHLSEILLV